MSFESCFEFDFRLVWNKYSIDFGLTRFAISIKEVGFGSFTKEGRGHLSQMPHPGSAIDYYAEIKRDYNAQVY